MTEDNLKCYLLFKEGDKTHFVGVVSRKDGYVEVPLKFFTEHLDIQVEEVPNFLPESYERLAKESN